MKDLNISEIAAYLGVTKRTAQRRAVRENWPYSEHCSLGGIRRHYAFVQLPESIKATVTAAMIMQMEQKLLELEPLFAAYHDEVNHSTHWQQHRFFKPLGLHKPSKPYIKQGLIHLAYLYANSLGQGKIKGFDQFCQQYNSRAFDIAPAIYHCVNNISRISLIRWENSARDTAKTAAITTFDAELKLFIQEVITLIPNITAKRLWQHLSLFFEPSQVPPVNVLNAWQGTPHNNA